jgi:hypothetical protein
MDKRYRIEKGIPYPDRGKWVRLMEAMEEGDSVLLEDGEALAFRSSLYTKGWRGIVEREGGKTRVWKVRGLERGKKAEGAGGEQNEKTF